MKIQSGRWNKAKKRDRKTGFTNNKSIPTVTDEKQQGEGRDEAGIRVQEVVDELRILLQENALTKKTQQQRLKILTSAFYRNTTRFSEDMSIATNLVPNKNSISFSL